MEIVLGGLIPATCRVFLDDIGVKGPKNESPEERHPKFPGLRKFVFDHFLNLKNVLFLLEVARLTISREKKSFWSSWC